MRSGPLAFGEEVEFSKTWMCVRVIILMLWLSFAFVQAKKVVVSTCLPPWFSERTRCSPGCPVVLRSAAEQHPVSFWDPAPIRGRMLLPLCVLVLLTQQVPAGSCFVNSLVVVLIKGSLEMKDFFFSWFAWKRTRRVKKKKKRVCVCVKQQVEPKLLWFHKILWFNQMDELSREL